jgi:hypothetical protein
MRKPSPSTQGWKPISKRRTRRPILFCQSLQVSDKPAASRTIHLASTLPCWSPIWPIECLSLRGEIRRFQAFRAIKVLICVAVPFLMVSCRPMGLVVFRWRLSANAGQYDRESYGRFHHQSTDGDRTRELRRIGIRRIGGCSRQTVVSDVDGNWAVDEPGLRR